MRKLWKKVAEAIGNMDEFGENEKIYEEMSITVGGIYITLVEMYLMFIFNGVDLFEFSMVESPVLKTILQVVTQMGAFAVTYIALYKGVYAYKKARWIKKHKDIWVKGIWLHIHIKDPIRVGTVEIQQNFYEITAKGKNIEPIRTDRDGEHITEWHYSMGKMFDEAKNPRDYIGYYSAFKQKENVTNEGMHALTVEEKDKQTGFPTVIRGNFYDTIKFDNVSMVPNQHRGELLLFKPSQKCLDYINKGRTLHRLQDMIQDEAFADEPFVIELQEIMAEEAKKKASK